MPAITPPDLRNVRNISSPTETYRKVSMPTVYCKSRCNVTPDTVNLTWTPKQYTVIGTTSIAYDYKALGEDKVLADNFIAHYAGSHNVENTEYMDGALFPRMDDMPVRVGAIYKQDLFNWCEVVTPDRIRFGYGEGLDVGGDVEVDPDKSFDISKFGSDFKESRKIWSALPEYIIMTIGEYNAFVDKPPFELDTSYVEPDKKKDKWVIARLDVGYEETTTPGSSTWIPPTDNAFLTTQTGASYTPPTNQHICYISDPDSPYYGRYYTKNSGTGYTELTTHVPWLWRNNEPFYIKNEGSTGLNIEWAGPLLGTSTGDSTRHVWANIIVNSSGQIINTWISDYDDYYGNQGKVGAAILNNSMPIPAGCKCYIFRLDQSTAFKHVPTWASEGSWACRGCFDDRHQNLDSYAWTPGASFFGTYGVDSGGGDLIVTPWIMSSNAHVSIGGCLSSLFISCAVSGYSYVNSQAGYTAAQAFAQEVFTNPAKHCWINQNVSFRADGLFERANWLYDAKNLEFPITAVPFMYDRLFYGCENLQHAPTEFPAFQMAPAMYTDIFNMCYSIQDCPIFYANRMWDSTGIYPSKTSFYRYEKRFDLDDGVIHAYNDYQIDISACGMTDGFSKVTHIFDGYAHSGDRIPSIGLPSLHLHTKAIAWNNSNVWTAHLRPTILEIDTSDGGYTWATTNTHTTGAQKIGILGLNHDPTVNNIDTESGGKYSN